MYFFNRNLLINFLSNWYKCNNKFVYLFSNMWLFFKEFKFNLEMKIIIGSLIIIGKEEILLIWIRKINDKLVVELFDVL